MKKIYALLVIAFITFSCSESDDFSSSNEPQFRQPIRPVIRLEPTKLARVVYSPGASNQQDWYFNAAGLLRKITKPNGTILKDFFYDAHKNLITSHNYTTAGTYTYSFVYDSSNHITSLNGRAVIYNAATNQYVFYYQPIISNNPECPTCYDYTDRTEITLNSDLLITNERTYYLSSAGNYSYGGMFASYTNSNMIGVSGWTDPSGPIYHYDVNTNPLKQALLPICRAMGITDGSYFEKWAVGQYNSVNNLASINYDDGMSETYVYSYNANNLPSNCTRNAYDGGNLISSHPFAIYYYQGDVIP